MTAVVEAATRPGAPASISARLTAIRVEPLTGERLARIREQPAPAPTKAGALAQWRRNGAGSQILHDLGARHLRVLGTPRRQVGLAGFGLEVVEYVALPAR